ncbi:MAG: S-layer homology domain-containing protein [Candidatus Limnocylindrales bacterium]
MRITIELRRPARRSVALLIGLLLLAVPGVALAVHDFPDVTNANPFHSQISSIARAGITAGFNDGGYHPSEAVTRQAMAAFMQRGFGRVALSVGTAPTTASFGAPPGMLSSSFVAVRQISIGVPGASNAFSPEQLVHLRGKVAFSIGTGEPTPGCSCQFQALVRDLTAATTSLAQVQTFDTISYNRTYSFDVEAVFSASPGPRTYQLEVMLVARNDATSVATFYPANSTSLVAMTFPFSLYEGNTP